MAQQDTNRPLQPQCLRRFDASTQVPKTRKMGGGKSLPNLAGLHVLFARAVPGSNGAQTTSQSIADLSAHALDSATCVPHSLAFQFLSLLCDLYSTTHKARSQRTHVRGQSEPEQVSSSET